MVQQREVGRLRAAAALVQEDLRRTLDASWSCWIGDDFTLHFGAGDDVRSVALGTDIDEDAVPLEWEPQDDGVVFDEEAETAVVEGVQHALEDSGLRWPSCAVHSFPLGVCGGTWICGSDDEHEVSALGRLAESDISAVPHPPT